MRILSSTFVFRQPIEHRLTKIEGDSELSYISRTYDLAVIDGAMIHYPECADFSSVTVPLLGCYLVEQLEANGTLTGDYLVLTARELRDQLGEYSNPDLEYGVRQVRPDNLPDEQRPGAPVRTINEGVERARAASDVAKHYTKFEHEVVSRPVGTNAEWTVVAW